MVDDELLIQYENLSVHSAEIPVTDKDIVNLVYIGVYVSKSVLIKRLLPS